jgi:hypothetical protein
MPGTTCKIYVTESEEHYKDEKIGLGIGYSLVLVFMQKQAGAFIITSHERRRLICESSWFL